MLWKHHLGKVREVDLAVNLETVPLVLTMIGSNHLRSFSLKLHTELEEIKNSSFNDDSQIGKLAAHHSRRCTRSPSTGRRYDPGNRSKLKICTRLSRCYPQSTEPDTIQWIHAYARKEKLPVSTSYALSHTNSYKKNSYPLSLYIGKVTQADAIESFLRHLFLPHTSVSRTRCGVAYK